MSDQASDEVRETPEEARVKAEDDSVVVEGERMISEQGTDDDEQLVVAVSSEVTVDDLENRLETD